MKSHQYLTTRRFGLCLLSGVFSLFGVLLLSSGASAYNFGTAGQQVVRPSNSYTTNNGTYIKLNTGENAATACNSTFGLPNGFNGSAYGIFNSTNLPASGTGGTCNGAWFNSGLITEFQMNTNVTGTTDDGIPANSFVTGTIRLAATNNQRFTFSSLSSGMWGFTLLDYSCSDYITTATPVSGGSNTSTEPTDFVCQYYGYNTTDNQTLINIKSRINYYSPFVAVYSPISYITITSESGGSADISQLSTDVGTILATLRQNNTINADIYYDIEDIKDLLEELTTTGALSQESIESAIQNASEAARESEKEEYEDQQESVESGAESAGEEAENATSSLISNARNILETIRDTPATNCVIRIQRGSFDTGNLDLCAVPQTIRTMISAAITIPVTIAALHIIYSVVYTYLTAVRKEQE